MAVVVPTPIGDVNVSTSETQKGNRPTQPSRIQFTGKHQPRRRTSSRPREAQDELEQTELDKIPEGKAASKRKEPVGEQKSPEVGRRRV